MAKSKSKHKAHNQQGKLSPERFFCEKARNQPIGKCYVSPPDWKEEGIVNVIITRERKNGNIVLACFLVDTFCLGVKNVSYDDDMPEDLFKDYLMGFEENLGLDEISYTDAHNLILGAVEFAEEGGIEPHKKFVIAQYILEEDNDEIPMIQFEYGKDGKHFLVPFDRSEIAYIPTLQKNLGDNFDYDMPLDFDDEEYYDEDFDDGEWISDEDYDFTDDSDE